MQTPGSLATGLQTAHPRATRPRAHKRPPEGGCALDNAVNARAARTHGAQTPLTWTPLGRRRDRAPFSSPSIVPPRTSASKGVTTPETERSDAAGADAAAGVAATVLLELPAPSRGRLRNRPDRTAPPRRPYGLPWRTMLDVTQPTKARERTNGADVTRRGTLHALRPSNCRRRGPSNIRRVICISVRG